MQPLRPPKHIIRRHLCGHGGRDVNPVYKPGSWAAVPTGDGTGQGLGPDLLNDCKVARLVKRSAMAADVRGDLSEIERAEKLSGHSLRAGLASSAEVEERYVQMQLGHASAEMIRRYQRRRDRFRVNLTKAAGL